MKTRRTFSVKGLRFYADGEGSPGSGEGYASTFDTINSYGDCIKKGAFLDCLPDFKRMGFVAFGHAWDAAPVGTITDAYEDEIGLFVKWDFHSTEAAQDARKVAQERMDRGKNVGLSIGFSIAKNGFVPIDPEEPWGGWNITKVKTLYEFSIVNAAADPKAAATRIQSDGGALHDGATLADQTDALLDDAEEIIGRYAALYEMRNVAEGRRWSEDNARRLTAWQDRAAQLADALSALLKDPEAEAAEAAARLAAERDSLSLLIDLQRLRVECPVGV